MEGVTGVVSWDDVTPEHAEYTRFRRLMTGDVNTAIRGAYEAGADEVIVTDGHHLGRNLLIEELDAHGAWGCARGMGMPRLHFAPMQGISRPCLFQTKLGIYRLADVIECLFQVRQSQPGRPDTKEGPGDGA
jgi:D-aminopeptidase